MQCMELMEKGLRSWGETLAGKWRYSRGKQRVYEGDCQCQVVVNMMAIKKDREWNSFMEKGSFLDL